MIVYPRKHLHSMCIHSSKATLQAAKQFCTGLFQIPNIILLGDFNLPDCNWSSLTSPNYFDSLFLDILFELNLAQPVQVLTHQKGNILDLIFTNITLNFLSKYSKTLIILSLLRDICCTPTTIQIEHVGTFSRMHNREIGL